MKCSVSRNNGRLWMVNDMSSCKDFGVEAIQIEIYLVNRYSAKVMSSIMGYGCDGYRPFLKEKGKTFDSILCKLFILILININYY